MYFTDDNPKSKSIMRATMGGSDEVVLFHAVSPGDLAVDKQEQKLFWTDTGMKKIEYGDLTGKYDHFYVTQGHEIPFLGLSFKEKTGN